VPGTAQEKFSVQIYSWAVPGTLIIATSNSGFHSDLSIGTIFRYYLELELKHGKKRKQNANAKQMDE